ncbi:MAG TPA: PIN domain-containing protein [Candidatus Nanoarchaeia archaeon]|nr:PIN domain-containing protein [Candidatus Nanoarchaeia archaeon]
MGPNYYLDASCYIYLFLEHPQHIPQVLLNLHRLNIITSTLTYDEVVWIVRKKAGKSASYDAADIVLALDQVAMSPITKEIIARSRELMEELDIHPRDSIHLAAAQHQSCSLIVSEDSDFDKVKGIKRISTEEFINVLLKR